MVYAYPAFVAILVAVSMFLRLPHKEYLRIYYSNDNIKYRCRMMDRQRWSERVLEISVLFALFPLIGSFIIAFDEEKYLMAEKLAMTTLWTFATWLAALVVVGGGRTIFYQMRRTAKQI